MEIKEFVKRFFDNLKCLTSEENGVLTVKNVPKSFEELYGEKSPYRFSFSSGVGDAELVSEGGPVLLAINKYLESAGKTTLLQIDLDVNPLDEIKKVISLRNCSIDNIIKRRKNNFFSRFSFITTFHYLNEKEESFHEIYIHNGKVVNGDLSGYRVLEGEKEAVSAKHIEEDYKVAKEFLKGLLAGKTKEISEELSKKIEIETERINEHYNNLTGELGSDLNTQMARIKETEMLLEKAKPEESDFLKAKLERLHKNIEKIGETGARDKIAEEREFVIRDAVHKHSLNIGNKLINTTVIYYPVFSFSLCLKGDDSERCFEMTYDPLTKELDKVKCETCSSEIKQINLCSGRHITCEKCLIRCGECHREFCKKCLRKSCSSCGKFLCKDCAIMCRGCGKYTCKSHLRKDSVSGEERCINCLRACFRCNGFASAQFFGVALDGSKICQKCLGKERSLMALRAIRKED